MFGVQFTGKANKRPLSTDVATRSQCNFPSLRVQTEAFLFKRNLSSRGVTAEKERSLTGPSDVVAWGLSGNLIFN